MEFTPNTTRNIIVAVIAIIIILIGAYEFDHRYEDKTEGLTASTTVEAATTTLPGTTSSLPAFPASAQSTGSNANTASQGQVSGSNLLKLPTITLTSKENTSSWQSYVNTMYKFSLSYPQGGDVRKFIGGANDEYGIGLTYEQSGARFTEKYFELTVDQGATTECDALVDDRTSTEVAMIGKQSFIRREYNDGTSHVVEYTSKVGQLCYRGYLRLNNPSTGTPSAAAGDATTKSEMQMLEDIMSTFMVRK